MEPNRKLVAAASTFRNTLVVHPKWTYEKITEIAGVSYSEAEWADIRKLTELFTGPIEERCKP